MRHFFVLATALAAALYAAPSPAAVIPVFADMTSGSGEITLLAGTTSGQLDGDLEGNVTGQIFGPPPATITILAVLEIAGSGRAPQTFDLGPTAVPFTTFGTNYTANFAIPVALTVDLAGYEYINIRPDFLIGPTSSFSLGSQSAVFGGTLTFATPTAVPEPASLALLGLGLAGALAQRRRSSIIEPAA